MKNLAVSGFTNHERRLGMCSAFALLRKDFPIDAEDENCYPKTSDTVNPKPCSTSDGNLSKNALCNYYSQCLNMAVEKKWSQFTCIDCILKNIHTKIELNAGEILGCLRLLSKLFMEKKRGAALLNVLERGGDPLVFTGMIECWDKSGEDPACIEFGDANID